MMSDEEENDLTKTKEIKVTGGSNDEESNNIGANLNCDIRA